MLYYVSNADLPGKKAHTIQQMKMCQAFSATGEEVHFFHPSYGKFGKRLQWEDIAQYYNLRSEFSINTLPTLQDRPRVPEKAALLSMTGSLASWLLWQVATGDIDHRDVIYSRNYYPTFAFLQARRLLPENRRPKVVAEYHDTVSAVAKDRFFRSIDGLVCITEALRQHCLATYDISPESSLVAPDGVDLAPYQGLTQVGARNRLGLPIDADIVAYTGHLYPGKGGTVLARAAHDIDGEVYIVGGHDEDIERIRSNVEISNNTTFTGFVDPSRVPLYQVAADILVAPYTHEARDFVSPLKLFEYMASGRPIVSSDLPVLKEVLTHRENAVLAEPGDSGSLADSIGHLLDTPQLAKQIAATATDQVEQYTWERRAERITTFTESLDRS